MLLVGGVAHAAEVDEVNPASDVISPAAPTHLTYTEGYSPLYGALPGVLEWAPATDDVTDSHDLCYRLYHDGQSVTLFGTLLGGGRHSVNFYDEILVCWNSSPDGWYTVTAIDLRVSQINGCSWCTVEHAQQLRDAGESEERIAAVAAWREAPYFSDAERVALALAEALTRINDTPNPIPDSLWDEVSQHYDERQLSGLLLEISKINVWNRLNVAVRQIADTTPGA